MTLHSYQTLNLHKKANLILNQSKQYLPWNFWINVGDISFYHLAGSFVFITTLLPVYVRHLTESLVLIGLIPATFYLFAQLPQVLFASCLLYTSDAADE